MTGAPRIARCARMSILCVQLSAATLCLDPAPAAADYSQDAVKAAYLFRFAGYVDWPGTADPAKPFVIAVVGAPAVARELRRLVPGHQINNRFVAVVEANRVADAGRPAILSSAGVTPSFSARRFPNWLPNRPWWLRMRTAVSMRGPRSTS
jgi:hypothetical protein